MVGSVVHIYGSEGSKTEPFENRTLKRSVFEWIQNSSPDCSPNFEFSHFFNSQQRKIQHVKNQFKLPGFDNFNDGRFFAAFC